MPQRTNGDAWAGGAPASAAPQLMRVSLGGTNGGVRPRPAMRPLRQWSWVHIGRLWVIGLLAQAAIYGAVYASQAQRRAADRAQARSFDSLFQHATPIPDSLLQAFAGKVRDSLGIWTERRGSTTVIHAPPALEQALRSLMDSLGAAIDNTMPSIFLYLAMWHIPVLVPAAVTLLWLVVSRKGQTHVQSAA